jgi:quercetin dioxygenase-like cupin family protein
VTTEPYAVARLAEIEPVEDRDRRWRQVRHHFGIEAFGVNAWSADAGAEVVNEHSEQDGDEELYFVASGRATFTIDGDDVDAPTGTFVFVRPGTSRRAVAAEDGTTVVVVGAPPGEPYVAFGWELFLPAYNRGDYDEAAAALREALATHPDDTRVVYNLACVESLTGRHDDAVEHLRRAIELRPELADHARSDSDLDAIRDDPRFESAVAGKPDAAGTGA